jgi:phosphate transport system substrate-binding protein
MTYLERNKSRRWMPAPLIALCLSLAAVGCTSDPTTTTSSAAALSGTLNMGGATSQTAAQEAWRAGFQDLFPDVTVNYDPTGSGTGQSNFASGGYAVAGSDAATDASGPFSGCAPGSPLVQIPAYISPIAIVFTLPGIDTVRLDAATIAGIFAGTITSWADPAITATNPGVALPSTVITPVHRSDNSGTTWNFTDYLAQAAPQVWTWGAAQAWPEALNGEAAQGTQGVHDTVTAASGTIGYIDASQSAGLGITAIQVGDQYNLPTAAGAALAVGASPRESGRAPSDVVVDLDRTPASANAYPLVLVSYLIACGQYADASVGPLAKAYLDHVVSDAGQQAAAANAGSAPLSSDPDLAAAVGAAVAAMS